MREFWQQLLVQFREFFREPGILFWAIAFPIVMAWGLGIAFTRQGEQIRHVAWVQKQAGQALEKMVRDTTSQKKDTLKINGYLMLGNEKTGFTRYEFTKARMNEAERMIKRGEASMIIEEEGDSIYYHFDPKNPEGQLAYLQISAAVRNKTSQEDSKSVVPFSRTGMRYIDFLIPGLIGMNVMFSCMWGISYTLIERRSKKLLRRMVATPMSKMGFLLSHFTARLILSYVETILLFGFAVLYFHSTIQGSLLAVILLIAASNMAFCGIAVLFSARTSNTQIGNGIINAVTMPMLICSGVFFSYHNFPDWMIPIIKFFPLTLIADNLRAIFIEGAGLKEALMPIIILSVSGLVFFLIGKRIYKWY